MGFQSLTTPVPGNAFRRAACQIAVAVLAGVVALVAAGCGGDGDDGAGAGSVERFRVGSTAKVDSLNPFAAISALSDGVGNLIYPALVQYDEGVREIVPDFASEWEIGDGGRQITLTTADAQWSDGEPLNAEDAAWSINLIIEHQEGPTAAHAGFVQGIESAEATDATTLVVRYEKPVAGALARLQRIKILPEQEWGEHAAGDGSGLTRFAPAPPLVAGGPFTVERYAPEGVTLLTRNDEYYGEAPAVATVGFQPFGSPDALIAALQNGEIDAIDQLPANVSLDRLESSSAVVGRENGPGIDWLIFNSNPDKPRHRELLDPRVRQAISQAIDRDEIVEVAWRGNAEPALAILPTSNDFHNDALQPPAFDPQAANRALDGLGYRRGPDGVRVADGERMSYEVPSADTTNSRTFEIVRNNLAKIGVEVEQRILDFPAMSEAISAPDGEHTEFDIAFWGFNASPEPSSIVSLPTCAARAAFNEPYYCNRRYDALFERQARTIDDKKRAELLHEMQAILARDLPYIPLNYTNFVSAHAEGWENLEMSSYGFLNARLTKLPFIKAQP